MLEGILVLEVSLSLTHLGPHPPGAGGEQWYPPGVHVQQAAGSGPGFIHKAMQEDYVHYSYPGR